MLLQATGVVLTQYAYIVLLSLFEKIDEETQLGKVY